MEKATMVGASIALGSGLAIGLQSTLLTVIGRTLGPVRASLILNVTGGILARIIVIAAIGIQGSTQLTISGSTLLAAVISVAIGLGVLVGIGYSFQRMGVGAGIATVFLGQMLIGVVVDTLGLSSGDAMPLDLRRVLGLLVMATAVMLLVRET